MRRARNQRFDEKGYVTHGCMVAELTFGFWTKMLLSKHEANYWTPIQTLSPNLPPDVTYHAIEARCKAVTELRSRIFHHEPLLGRDISREYRDTLELVWWIDPKLADWIRPQLRIMSVLRERPRHRT